MPNDLSGPIHGLGHNRGPVYVKPATPAEVTAYLNHEHQPLIERCNECLAALDALLVSFTTTTDDGTSVTAVTTDEQCSAVDDTIKLSAAAAKLIVAQHTIAKADYKAAADACDAWKNAILAKFTTRKEQFATIVTAYKVQVEAARKAIAAAEAERLRVLAQEQAAAALKAAPTAQEAAFDVAEQTAAQQTKMEKAATVRPRGGTTSRGAYGSSNLKRTWSASVTDFARVPDAYKIINTSALEEAKRQRDPETNRPTAIIPGIEWQEAVNTTFR